MPLTIRPATEADENAIWLILGPMIAAGETYALPREWNRQQILDYWKAPEKQSFVAEQNGRIMGTYYLRANQLGGGSHVANCGYVTAEWATGQGVARAMCTHSLDMARRAGFLAMQFNLVVSTNRRAISLWQNMGFTVIGRLPHAFRHPQFGLVDAFIMHQRL